MNRVYFEISSCTKCPCKCKRYFAEKHSSKHVDIPDWCPLIIGQLKEIYSDIINSLSYHNRMNITNYLLQSSAKYGSDHGFNHARRVIDYGLDFIEQVSCLCAFDDDNPKYHFSEKDLWLFKIAALLHDYCIVTSTNQDHAAASARYLKEYFKDELYLEPEDLDKMAHAIAQHSEGKDINNILDAALFLGDKLDMSSKRIIAEDSPDRPLRPILKEMQKIKSVEFVITSKNDKPYGAELCYNTYPCYQYPGDFKVSALRAWPKCITSPKMIAKDYLGLKHFHFCINNQIMDLHHITGKH